MNDVLKAWSWIGNWKKFFLFSSSSNVFRLHDFRFILVLFQTFFAICQLCSAALVSAQISQWMPFFNSSLILLSLLAVNIFVRLIEIQDCIDWIYVAILIEIGQVVLGTWKFYYLNEALAVGQFQSLAVLSQLLVAALLVVLDCTTKYLEPMKVKILADSSEHLSSRDNRGFSKGKCTLLSKLTFWWLMPILWQGFFDPLELEDLGTLPEKETSRFHYDQFLFIYSKNSGGRVSMPRVLPPSP